MCISCTHLTISKFGFAYHKLDQHYNHSNYHIWCIMTVLCLLFLKTAITFHKITCRRGWCWLMFTYDDIMTSDSSLMAIKVFMMDMIMILRWSLSSLVIIRSFLSPEKWEWSVDRTCGRNFYFYKIFTWNRCNNSGSCVQWMILYNDE